MKILFNFLLIIHIIAGSIALTTGTINIIRKKGDKPHRRIGKFFFYGMIINAVAGFVLSILHQNLFLLIIAVFSFYMTMSGQRFLSLKRIYNGQKPKIIDWMLTTTMGVFAVFFLIYGFYLLLNDIDFGMIVLIFGLISILMIKSDIKIYRGNIKHQNYWLSIHIQRMTGAYIAALTAFLVVNNIYLPAIVAWFLPTVILTPLIIYWSNKFAK